MARRKKRSRSGFFAKAKRYARKGSRGASKIIHVDAMLYGAVRPYIANLISPATNMLPFGNLKDEVGMGILDYYVAKKGGALGEGARKGLIVENASVGSTLSTGLLRSQTSNTANGTFMYG